jgi:hypothetical protein
VPATSSGEPGRRSLTVSLPGPRPPGPAPRGLSLARDSDGLRLVGPAPRPRRWRPSPDSLTAARALTLGSDGPGPGPARADHDIRISHRDSGSDSDTSIWILARYDIVRLRTMSYVHPTTSYGRRTMSGSTSHVRYRTYVITYDIARTTSYVCQHRRCDIRHRMSEVRYRRFRKIYVVYDVVCQPKPMMSYV